MHCMPQMDSVSLSTQKHVHNHDTLCNLRLDMITVITQPMTIITTQ